MSRHSSIDLTYAQLKGSIDTLYNDKRGRALGHFLRTMIGLEEFNLFGLESEVHTPQYLNSWVTGRIDIAGITKNETGEYIVSFRLLETWIGVPTSVLVNIRENTNPNLTPYNGPQAIYHHTPFYLFSAKLEDLLDFDKLTTTAISKQYRDSSGILQTLNLDVLDISSIIIKEINLLEIVGPTLGHVQADLNIPATTTYTTTEWFHHFRTEL